MIISLTKHSALFGIRDGYLKHEPGDRMLELWTISAYTVRRSGALRPFGLVRAPDAKISDDHRTPGLQTIRIRITDDLR